MGIDTIKEHSPDELSGIEELIKERFEGKLEMVRVGDFQIEPWKCKGLFAETPDPEIFSGEEVKDPKERLILTQQAIDAAQEILKANFGLDEPKNRNAWNRNAWKDFAGLCEQGSALTQELLAHAGVRTVQVYGIYHAQKTERYLGGLHNPFQEDGDYPHHWLYESISGTIPTSTPHARDDLLQVDPTRCQFDKQKPIITHLDEGKHEVERPDSNFNKKNSWLWNETELEQWQAIISSLVKK